MKVDLHQGQGPRDDDEQLLLDYGTFAYLLLLAFSVSLFGMYKLVHGGLERLLDLNRLNTGYIWILVGVICFAAARREWLSRKKG